MAINSNYGKGMVFNIMVNRVDGNHYYEYTKTQNLNVQDTGEKFSLDYKQEELPGGKSQKEKEASEREKQNTAEQSGVRVDISGYGRTAGTDRKQGTSAKSGEAAGQGQSVISMIQDIFRTAIAAFKDFFDKIWNDPQTDIKAAEPGLENAPEVMDTAQENDNPPLVRDMGTVPETNEPETAETFYQNEARLNREIQPYLRKGDLNQVINLLTDNGKKTAARNSTLLTYYDRNGRMIEPSASDSQRILYGDRNARRL